MHIGNENCFMGNSCAHALQAFNVLHKRYRMQIRNLIGHHSQREEDIDDMLQIVLLNGFQCFKRGRRYSIFYPTLYSMAMDGIKNHYGSAREMQSDFLDLFDGMDYSGDALNMFHEDSPEQICSAMETGMEIIRLMTNLPPPLKNALLSTSKNHPSSGMMLAN